MKPNAMKRMFPRLLCLPAALCLCSTASACAFLETGGSLPDTSSFRVRSGPGVAGSGLLQLDCSAVVLTLLGPVPSITATITSPVTGLTLKNGTDSIPYTLTNGTGTPYTTGQLVINASGAAVLGLFSTSGTRVPVNITTGTSANVAAGTYTDTVTVRWTYLNICEGLLTVGGLCVGGTSSQTNVTRTLTMTLNVTADCAITAPPVQFGSAPLLASFAAVNQNLGLLCTKGLAYTVGISPGNNALAGGRRQMASGTARLQYDIFQPGGVVWGALGAARLAGAAPADGLNSQLLPYTARIYTDQPAPAAGSYTDSLTVDVGF
jgi:spore coat protein U-like protein